MSRQGYSQYKQSGVSWLGKIPEHWDPVRLRYRTKINPIRTEINCLPDTLDVSFVPMNSVHEYGGLALDQLRPLAEVSTGYTYFRDGDVLAAKITPCFENGKGAIAHELMNGIGFGTTELHVLRPHPSMDRHFLFYVTISHAFRHLGAAEMYGAGGQKRVPEIFIRDFRQSIPPLEEQRTIAAFLNHEAARIDALIKKKQRQIELLQEKRLALITQAVTKGLDPNIKMKESGIEWLGEIPKHWKVLAVKFILAMPITDGPHETPEFLPDGVPFLSAESVKGDRLDFSRKRGFISEEDHAKFSKKYVPKRGDVYMVKSGATTGNVARVETDEVFNIWSPLAVLRPHPTHSTTDFIFYFMKSKAFLSSVELAWSYGTQQNIGMGVVSNLRIALPPLDEQKSIAATLNAETDRIDALVRKVQGSIGMLREFRASLISAAVTGKIDVREEL